MGFNKATKGFAEIFFGLKTLMANPSDKLFSE
jgi:hypothetical protein